MKQVTCWSCGAENETPDPIPRDSECRECRRDLRCCMACRFYDTAYNNSCREPDADPVTDKDRRNFCEFFSYGPTGKAAAPPRADDARKRLDALFGGKPAGPSKSSDARQRLEDLFKKKPTQD